MKMQDHQLTIEFIPHANVKKKKLSSLSLILTINFIVQRLTKKDHKF